MTLTLTLLQAQAFLALITLGGAGYLYWAVRERALQARPILLGFTLLGLALPLQVGLTWTNLLEERFVRFERPLWSLPCAIVVCFVLLRLRGFPGKLLPLRRTLFELTYAAAALAAALAVLGCEIGKRSDRLTVIALVDRSRSIDLVPNADARIRAELQVAELGMRADDRIGTVAFAADAALESPPRPRSRQAPAQRVELGRDGTDIAAGIRRALSEVAADSAARIALLSDGVVTRGDTVDAASAAALAGVPIDVVPLDQSQIPDVRVIGVRTTARAHEGETLDLRVATASSSDAEVEVRIYRDGELSRRGNLHVRKGEDVLHLREQAPEPGLHRYEVQLTSLDAKLDQAAEDNSGATFVRVRGPALALVLDADPELALALTRALKAAAFRVTSAGKTAVPADLAGFAAYDLVVLSDIAASDLSATQIDALASYVRDLGGGLLLMGGDKSLGPGGYGRTPIEEISPVSFDLKQERRRASLAEIIAIDYSGSMSARAGMKTKLDLANEAAVRSAELLGAGDRLGVMHVDTSVRWTVPLSPIGDRSALSKAIRGVNVGGGGIYVDLALREAYQALEHEKVNLKHVLLFADGSDAEERQGAFALVSAAKARGITTSVIALGRGADVPDLEHMSKLGDGRFYLIEDAARLPAVFAQETILAARSSINEIDFRAALGAPSAALRGIDFSAAPSLKGYVVTIPKARAQVHLYAAERDPLLATWSVGIGKSAVFTSDYKDRWGVNWTSWSGAAELFGQLARDLARRADDARVRIEADAAGGELHVRANVVDDDGRAEMFRRLKARVGGPDGFTQELTLEAVGPGAYAAHLALGRPGTFIVTAIDEASNTPLATTGAVLTAGEELRPTGSDRQKLAQVAALTGGKMRDTVAGVFRDRDTRRFTYGAISGPLSIAAACLLLLAVAVRRLSPPEFLSALPVRLARARALRAETRRAQARVENASRQSEADVQNALLLAKVRARERFGGSADQANEPSMPTPHAGRAEPAAALESRAPSVSPARDSLTASQATEGAAHKPSAAEILLARRRGRKS